MKFVNFYDSAVFRRGFVQLETYLVSERMGFEREHDQWLCNHLKQRKGERLDALKRGHGYGNRLFVEQIWWPLAGYFHGLHLEYEVRGIPIPSLEHLRIRQWMAAAMLAYRRG